MNVEQIKKQLLREAKANPKKAGLLGLLLVVAICFWAPKLVKLVSGSDTSGPSPAATVQATPSASPSDTKTQEVQNVHIPWEQLAEWIDRDERMKAHAALPLDRDPFTVNADKDSLADESPSVPSAASPQMLGLSLNSTIIGPKRQVALIGGRAYAKGKTVVAISPEGAIGFVVEKIEPRSVVLSRDGVSYQLKIEEKNQF